MSIKNLPFNENTKEKNNIEEKNDKTKIGEDNYQNVRLLLGTPFNPKIKEYDKFILKKGKFYARRSTLKYFKTQHKIEQDQYFEYLSLKSNSIKKRNETKKLIRISLLLNIMAFLVLISLMSYNLIENEQKIMKIFKSINNDFFSVVHIYNDLSIISKNLKLFGIREKLIYFLENQERSYFISFESLENYTLMACDDLNDEISKTMENNFYYSNTFTNLFNQTLIFNESNSSIAMTTGNFLLKIATLIDSIIDSGLFKIDNSDYRMILINNNLNTNFFNHLEKIFDDSLYSTIDMIHSKINKKNILIYIIISLIIIVGCYSYIKILRFYYFQSEKSGMLLSIDLDEYILSLIRELKIAATKKKLLNMEQMDYKDKNNNNDNNNNYYDNNNVDDSKNMNDEKELLKSKDMGNIDIKKIIENESKRRVKRKKKNIFKKNQKKNNIPISIYLSYLSKVIFVLILDLVPFFFQLFYKFYEHKSENIINLIQKLNKANYIFLSSYLFFFHTLIYPETSNATDMNILINLVDSAIENRMNTSKLFYETLEGFDNQNNFTVFFSINFCGYNNPFILCNELGNYYNHSFNYFVDLNTIIMKDIINTENLVLNRTNFELFFNEKILESYYIFTLITEYGLNELNNYLKIFIKKFINEYSRSQIIIFVINILFKIICQISLFILTKRLIEGVDEELKNIFNLIDKSIMPFLS